MPPHNFKFGTRARSGLLVLVVFISITIFFAERLFRRLFELLRPKVNCGCKI